jgi:hypothetical protein
VTLHIVQTYNTCSWYTGSVNAGASPQAHKWRGKTGARYDDEEKQQPARATVSRDKTARFASCAPHASAQLLSRPCPRARGSAGSLACVANLAANATRLARTTISAATGTAGRVRSSGLVGARHGPTRTWLVEHGRPAAVERPNESRGRVDLVRIPGSYTGNRDIPETGEPLHDDWRGTDTTRAGDEPSDFHTDLSSPEDRGNFNERNKTISFRVTYGGEESSTA